MLTAELFGTFVLVLIGPGSAILDVKGIGVLGVAIAFGLAQLIMCYAIGFLLWRVTSEQDNTL